MTQRLVVERTDGRRVDITITDRSDGDFHIDSPSAPARRATITAEPWVVVRQVHSARVVDAADLDLPVEADAIITDAVNIPIAVQGADCAPIAFATTSGPIAVAHVGWRGLVAGIVEGTVDRLGEVPHMAIVGPTICASCYEFSATDLHAVVERYGDGVRATSSAGTPALDLAEGIRAALAASGVSDVRFVSGCTSCDASGYSHRRNADPERHALVAVLREAGHAS